MSDVRETNLDPELEALQQEWGTRWCIWRARRSDDQPGEPPMGEFLATRPRDEAGTERTIMQPTAELLDRALRQQAQG